uniref:RNA polymerase I and III subunit D n=1 Tax=Apteryx owenii TaxID=8824 RepID=A0A8B9QA84_APTOW
MNLPDALGSGLLLAAISRLAVLPHWEVVGWGPDCPDVEFCGYCITHPSESKINFRIQTRGALPAIEPFRKGLNDLMGVCQHVLNTFERSMKEYRAQREEEMQ